MFYEIEIFMTVDSVILWLHWETLIASSNKFDSADYYILLYAQEARVLISTCYYFFLPGEYVIILLSGIRLLLFWADHLSKFNLKSRAPLLNYFYSAKKLIYIYIYLHTSLYLCNDASRKPSLCIVCFVKINFGQNIFLKKYWREKYFTHRNNIIN